MSTIPYLIELITQKQPEDNIIVLHEIKSTIFSHIATLVKFDQTKPPQEYIIFFDSFIRNIFVDDLFDFVITCNTLKLDKYKNAATTYFTDIINANSAVNIQNLFKIKNDIDDINDDSEWVELQ